MKVSTSVSLDPELLKLFRQKFPSKSISSFLSQSMEFLLDDKNFLVRRLDEINLSLQKLEVSSDSLNLEREALIKKIEDFRK